MDQDRKELLSKVINGGYCIGCGACASVQGAPFKMDFDEIGRLQPKVSAEYDSKMNGDVQEVCPFSDKSMNETSISDALFGVSCKKRNDKIGYYLKNYAGFVKEEDFRAKGSSGGFTTWILCQLYNKGVIDAVVHVKQNCGTNPCFSYGLSTSGEEIKKSAKSRYYPIELSEMIKLMRHREGKYAVVGLPCFIKAIRLLMHKDPILRSRIKMCIGLVCGHLKTNRFADLFRMQCDIPKEDFWAIDFRTKLGNKRANQYGIEIQSKQGSAIQSLIRPSNEFYGYLWGQGFFKYEACDYCDDVLAETADVTLGDAWLDKYIQDSEGTNIIVVRNKIIEDIITEGKNDKKIIIEGITEDEMVLSQDAGLRHRREGLSFRLFLKQKKGLWFPPRRVQPKHEHLNRKEKKKQRLRLAMANKSHAAFNAALQNNDFNIFAQQMASLVRAYDSIYNPNVLKSIGMSVFRALCKPLRVTKKFIQTLIPNLKFLIKYFSIRNKLKIIYALTPPPHLANIGDHAQVLAVYDWFEKHFPGIPIIELDKDRSTQCIMSFRMICKDKDVIFLHSGGNLGDRGKWSENARRAIIRAFKQNKIVSLPQTIYFSKTEEGEKEKAISQRIYGQHKKLTVIGRDPESGALAKELFPSAATFSMPDFVLSMKPIDNARQANTTPKILLCLRQDDESALHRLDAVEIENNLPYPFTRFDTTLKDFINVDRRKEVFQDTINKFLKHDIVITDRYHGLIFAVVCKKPTIVLRTVDHKLTSALEWFRDVNFVFYINSSYEISETLPKCLKQKNFDVADWNVKYFDTLPERLGLETYFK